MNKRELRSKKIKLKRDMMLKEGYSLKKGYNV